MSISFSHVCFISCFHTIIIFSFKDVWNSHKSIIIFLNVNNLHARFMLRFQATLNRIWLSIKAFFNAFRFKYRLLIVSESTLEEIVSVQRSGFSFVWYFLGLVVFIFVITSLLINFTSLRHFLPGNEDALLKAQVEKQMLKVDSLQWQFDANQLYLTNLQAILNGNVDVQKNRVEQRSPAPNMNPVNVKIVQKSERENAFDNQFEQNEQFNLNMLTNRSNHNLIPVFSTPMAGVILQHVDFSRGVFEITIASMSNRTVAAVSDGVVVFAGFTPDSHYITIIQQNGSFLSIYKNMDYLLKTVGDRVHTGEVIGMLQKSTKPDQKEFLRFELWKNGIPLNPENYIVF